GRQNDPASSVAGREGHCASVVDILVAVGIEGCDGQIEKRARDGRRGSRREEMAGRGWAYGYCSSPRYRGVDLVVGGQHLCPSSEEDCAEDVRAFVAGREGIIGRQQSGVGV